jgi:2-polyprenyl-6-methoxyphenol hydroxylase-like FAD-dependent oxidoreductase
VAGAVLAGGETLAADLVVDASGRSGRTVAWLTEAGLGPVAERTSGCGLIYYSRHFQLRDGVPDPPYASVLAGPRGDLGYLAYAIFVGDSRTFAVIIMAPPWDREFRALRHPEAYMRAARLLPGVAAWTDPDAALPITPVLPFGQVTNTVRDYLMSAGPVAPGLQPVGDALCHTNPSFAFGASMALHQAFTLADLLAVAADHDDLARRFAAAVGEDLRDRYRAVAEEDRDRARWWEESRSTSPTRPPACRCSCGRWSTGSPQPTRGCCAPWSGGSTCSTRLIGWSKIGTYMRWPSTSSAARSYSPVLPAPRCWRHSPRERRRLVLG